MERDMFETARMMGMDESNTCFCFGVLDAGKQFHEKRMARARISEIKKQLVIDVERNYIYSKYGYVDSRGYRLLCVTEFYDEAVEGQDNVKIVRRFLNKLVDCADKTAGKYLDKLFSELCQDVEILYHGCPDECDVRESQRIIKTLYSERFEALEHDSGRHTGTPGVKNLFEKIVDMGITTSRNIFLQIHLQLNELF